MKRDQDRGGAASAPARDVNRLLVLEVIRLHAPIARFEIAHRTGLTKPTVTHIVTELLKLGYVRELGRRYQSRGQPAVELDINPHAAFSIGLHLDRDLLTAVLVNLKGQILRQSSQEIAPPAPKEALALLSASYRELVQASGIDSDLLLGIGLVTVGPLDIENGHVSTPPNFPGWQDVPLRQQLFDASGVPVFLDNNATAAAIGERWYGIGQNYRHFVYVYIGLGIGGGLILDGRIYRGAGFNAGELGHIVVKPNGPPCACGARGCLEAVASLTTLQRELGPGYGNHKTLSRNLWEKDTALIAWLEEASDSFAQILGGIDNLLDVDAVIFGGRLPADVLTSLVDQIRGKLSSYRMRGRPHYAAVAIGRVGEDTAALGAAILPVYEAFAVEPNLQLKRRNPFASATREATTQ